MIATQYTCRNCGFTGDVNLFASRIMCKGCKAVRAHEKRTALERHGERIRLIRESVARVLAQREKGRKL